MTDFEYEFQMAQLNRKLDPDLETMYLMASPEYSFSQLEWCEGDSQVRRLCVSDLVPDVVARRFAEMIGSAED